MTRRDLAQLSRPGWDDLRACLAFAAGSWRASSEAAARPESLVQNRDSSQDWVSRLSSCPRWDCHAQRTRKSGNMRTNL